MDELVELENHRVQEHFDHEEQDFTPWLAENLDQLEASDLLDMSLEKQGREVSVGRYTADIIATDVEGKRTVIIENQFGQTDHEHLGKSLVYAAGREADVVVWIAETFTDEHVSTFRWLNDRTDEDVGLFAIKMGLRRIGDSPYAIEFQAVERPDQWRSTAGSGQTELESRQAQFWDAFVHRTEERGWPEYGSRTPQPRASYGIAIGYSDVYVRLSARFRSDELVAAVRFKDENMTFAGLDQAEVEDELRAVIAESGYEYLDETVISRLIWDEAGEGGMYDHLRLRCDALDITFDDREQWNDYHDWLIEAADLLDRGLNRTLE